MSVSQHLLRPHVAALALTLLFFLAHVDIARGVVCKTPNGAASPLGACDCTAVAISCNNKGLTAMPANLTNCTQYAARGILSIFFVRIPGSLQVGLSPLSQRSGLSALFFLFASYIHIWSLTRALYLGRSRAMHPPQRRAPCPFSPLPVPSRIAELQPDPDPSEHNLSRFYFGDVDPAREFP